MKKSDCRILILVFSILISALTSGYSEIKTISIGDDGLVDNFESGNFDHWRMVAGNLHQQPVKAWRQGIPFQQEGEYFIGTTETGGTSRWDFNDRLVGTLHSEPFRIDKDYLSFLVSGGRDRDNLYVALVRLEDGYVLEKATGNNSETLVREYWEVSDYRDELVYLEVMDRVRGDWGHINVDDFRLVDEKPEAPETRTPLVLAGPFKRIYNPSAGYPEDWYINDHCFLYGPDNQWHLFGITHEEPAKAWEEDNLAHATSKELTLFNWTRQEFALSVVEEEPWDEYHLWAPHVVKHKDTYYMYYCAGDEKGATYKIHLATSKDLWNWTRHPDNPVIVDGFHARDPMVVKIGSEWVMYYTATSKPEGGNHVVAYQTSRDLVHWKNREIAFTDSSVGKGGGPTESPFVLRRGKYWYLFIGPRGGYSGTDVFVSENPYHWDMENQVGHIESHAAEVVRDKDGRWWVSRCGWGQGGVYLAPLYWNDGQGGVETTVGVAAH